MVAVPLLLLRFLKYWKPAFRLFPAWRMKTSAPARRAIASPSPVM